jgi:Tfp pilus assembly protein PilO
MPQSLHDQVGWKFRARWVMGGLMAFSAAMFYLTWWRPAARIQDGLAADIAQARAELQELQSQSANLTSLEKEVYRLQADVEPLTRKLPKQADVAGFIREMGKISQQSAIKKWDCKQGGVAKLDSMSELPITMNVEGDFFSIYGFLKQAEEMQRLTRVHFLKLTKDQNTGQMQATVEMGLYFSE